MSNKSFQKKKVLVVEDEKVLAEVYYDKLKSLGFDVLCVHSKDKALDCFESFNPDLVLLDLMLPEKEAGFEILKKIKSKNKQLPVIVVSNLDQDTDKKLCRKLGADDFLIKSNVRLIELTSCVKRFTA